MKRCFIFTDPIPIAKQMVSHKVLQNLSFGPLQTGPTVAGPAIRRLFVFGMQSLRLRTTRVEDYDELGGVF